MSARVYRTYAHHRWHWANPRWRFCASKCSRSQLDTGTGSVPVGDRCRAAGCRRAWADWDTNVAGAAA
jgi:hypothetical protein